MMSRKHFIAFANAIGAIRNDETREVCTRLVAHVCGEDCVNFDIERFHARIDKLAHENAELDEALKIINKQGDYTNE